MRNGQRMRVRLHSKQSNSFQAAEVYLVCVIWSRYDKDWKSDQTGTVRCFEENQRRASRPRCTPDRYSSSHLHSCQNRINHC